MLISDVAVVSWLAVQTVALIGQAAITRNDTKWIKDTLKEYGLARKEQQDKANHKAEKQATHDTAADVAEAKLLEKLDNLNLALKDHIAECRAMEEVRNRKKAPA